MKTETNTVLVLNVSWQGAQVAVNGENKWIDWDALLRAANQDDETLREIYGDIYRQARQLATERNAVQVGVTNLAGGHDDLGAYTWAAVLTDMAGGEVSGRLVAADWGQTGSLSHAERDAEEARQELRRRGYDVR